MWIRMNLHFQQRDSKKNKKAVRWPKSWKVQFAAAIGCVLIIGSGIISVGGKNIIVNVFDRKFGGGEKTYVDTDESTLPTTEEGMTEEEAYAKIEETFGTKVVRESLVVERRRMWIRMNLHFQQRKKE